MLITKKHQYALRAVFELAKNFKGGPVKISRIAANQAIPERFLEVILAELKTGGFLNSKRGPNGGYELVVRPERLRVGDLMRFLTRNLRPDECTAPIPEANCPFRSQCAFFPMWEKVKGAIFAVYDETSFQDLLEHKQGEAPYPHLSNRPGDMPAAPPPPPPGGGLAPGHRAYRH